MKTQIAGGARTDPNLSSKHSTSEDRGLAKPRKLLVFAHTPPPHHGQSYMVQLMLDAFGGDTRRRRKSEIRNLKPCPNRSALELNGSEIECYHINARMSDDMEDIGGIRPGKILRLLKYCAQAVGYRFRYGVTTLYYVPAPAKKSAIVRDWLVMLLVRPFFRRTILHWHAFGLGHWATGTTEHPADGLSNPPPLLFGCYEKPARWLTRKLIGRADLSIVLTEYNCADAGFFQPKKIAVVPNGIPDPCPDFEQTVLPLRQSRLAARRALLSGQSAIRDPQSAIFRVLFLAHCTREKGLFNTLDAVALANSQLSTFNYQLRIHLTVAGSFLSDSERAEFNTRIAQPDLSAAIDHQSTINSSVSYVGFVSGAEKARLLRECDCLCSFSHHETFGLNVAEAMAFGMQAALTPIGAYQELFAATCSVAASRSVNSYADAIMSLLAANPSPVKVRNEFLNRFSADGYERRIRAITILSEL